MEQIHKCAHASKQGGQYKMAALLNLFAAQCAHLASEKARRELGAPHTHLLERLGSTTLVSLYFA